ncbi:MAG: ATP-binding protein [Treponema sp.]|nr:ATP-binding protein [Treponema sp.]
MALKKTNTTKTRKIANITSIVLYFFITAVFIFETTIARMPINYVYAVPLMLLALIVLTVIIRNTINHYKLAFNVPFALYLFYTALMISFDWKTNHYLLVYLALCAISCIYSHFNRTLTFIIIVNIINAVLIINNPDIYSFNIPLFLTLLNWGISLFASIIMLVLARAATIHLDRALEHQQSFMDLLDSTENYVAMVNEQNEVVYASKTLSQLSNTEDPSLVQGRPLIDLFPGKSLKLYAGKMLKEKDNYAEDWEFSLSGQKRYFKAASHGLRGGSSGALISLYDMTHLAERDEIAVMKDSMKIGLFFMDSNFIIQDHYSRYLEEMLSDTKLFGKLFTDIISDSVSTNELNAITDYFKMVLERSYDQDMLDDINPLHELHYVNKTTGDRKIFQFDFATVERGKGEVFILATVYDITIRVELLQRLAEEESRRQEEMQAVFELIQVDPGTFNDFMKDMEYELSTIANIQKNEALSAHESLVKIYQSVHAIKSNAVILGLNIFGKKVHNLESRIKKLREMEGNVPFAEMLNLTMEIEKIIKEKEGFKDTIAKLQTYAGGNRTAVQEKQNVKVLLESLSKTTSKAANDLEKQIKFIATDIDADAIDKGPRRVMKEILMQLIRNSAVHGIESPDDRKAKGKNETGVVKLSIKLSDDKNYILIRFIDDGQGLNYKRIAEKALSRKLIKKEDITNKDMLIKAIFSPGFSTAEVEGVHGGRGIGLNLVRDRIKEINGSIKLRSEDGRGVIFLVTLPVGEDK